MEAAGGYHADVQSGTENTKGDTMIDHPTKTMSAIEALEFLRAKEGKENVDDTALRAAATRFLGHAPTAEDWDRLPDLIAPRCYACDGRSGFYWDGAHLRGKKFCDPCRRAGCYRD